PVVGYHIYRAATAAGPFIRVSAVPVTGTSFTDTGPPAGDSTYMVRAIKLEDTPSGTYFNPSQGIFQSIAGPEQVKVYLPVVMR
ncbi:MAG: hypothetical protein HYR94_10680, partial [Chloroflexi bacterium]|nr:hypothetical protein [Chloroflexota bacterium]